jgi:hypothetical protein
MSGLYLWANSSKKATSTIYMTAVKLHDSTAQVDRAICRKPMS